MESIRCEYVDGSYNLIGEERIIVLHSNTWVIERKVSCRHSLNETNGNERTVMPSVQATEKDLKLNLVFRFLTPALPDVLLPA